MGEIDGVRSATQYITFETHLNDCVVKSDFLTESDIISRRGVIPTSVCTRKDGSIAFSVYHESDILDAEYGIRAAGHHAMCRDGYRRRLEEEKDEMKEQSGTWEWEDDLLFILIIVFVIFFCGIGFSIPFGSYMSERECRQWVGDSYLHDGHYRCYRLVDGHPVYVDIDLEKKIIETEKRMNQ